jgi:hypothetical protein
VDSYSFGSLVFGNIFSVKSSDLCAIFQMTNLINSSYPAYTTRFPLYPIPSVFLHPTTHKTFSSASNFSQMVITEIKTSGKCQTVVVLKESIAPEYFDIYVERNKALVHIMRGEVRPRTRPTRAERRVECTYRISRLISSINAEE